MRPSSSLEDEEEGGNPRIQYGAAGTRKYPVKDPRKDPANSARSGPERARDGHERTGAACGRRAAGCCEHSCVVGGGVL